ncbi:MAG: shikimate kinase [Bacteroidales bacterium]|nr:shikimate kinase [Bacteroidales bacterium]NPV36271.1 shikimate kinase [Bacteroidales bacterium]
MRIYLVGYMASGKTYTGPRLAEALGYNFLDLDEMFENKYRISIQKFFQKYGESAFRPLERELLHSTFQLQQHVISTGGGTACFFDNMQLMNTYGLTVYLKQSTEALFHRLKLSKKPRPLIKDAGEAELRQQIENHLAERIPYYEQARIIVDAAIEIQRLTDIIRMYPGFEA